MPETFFFTIRRALGRLKRKMFRTNFAIWFCGDLNFRALSDYDANVSMEFNYLEGSIEYIREKSVDFRWVYVQKEIDAARQYLHVYPIISCNGKKAGYIKIARNKAYVEDFDDLLTLREDEAFVCDTFIEPEYRGKGLSQILLSETIEWLKKHKVRYLFCHIPAWNKASLKLYQGAGFKNIHNVRHVRLFGHRFYTHNPKKILADGRKLYEPD